ncbi:MAG: PAS domain S-box protein [Desulfobulbaceae bacterium]|nr:PAS domain S-box protein [Desulfobulbaceae bacterium]
MKKDLTADCFSKSKTWSSYLLKYNPNTIIVTDIAGNIEYVNAVFTSLSGYLPEEAVGRNIQDLRLHDFDNIFDFSWKNLLHGDVWEGEIPCRKKNGAFLSEQVFILPITNGNGNVVRFAFIKRDVTKYKRVETKLFKMTEVLGKRIHAQKAAELEFAHLNRLHELILNSAAEGIFGVDIEGSITFMNPAAEKMTGYKTDELLGRYYQDYLRYGGDTTLKKTKAGLCPILNSLRTGKAHHSFEEIFVNKQKKSFPVQLVSSPILEDETVIGAVITFNDITEELRIQKAKDQAEKELRELNETLEQRVNRRTSQLSGANKDLLNTLEQLQKTQSHLVQSEKMASLGGLVAGVAHEINTPIGIGYTAATHIEKLGKSLEKNFHSGCMTKSELQDYLRDTLETSRLLCSNLNRAADLIRSFKQVAIDQSGEVKRVFHARQYLDEILLSLRPILKKTRHSVQIDCPAKMELFSFPGAFSQIFTNLITNSVTHAFRDSEAGSIHIHFNIHEDTLQIIYSDNGRGIPPKYLDQIFEPFFTTNRDKGGSGLGLHIIYNIITQQLLGSISCRCPDKGGTEFIITLPMAEIERK